MRAPTLAMKRVVGKPPIRSSERGDVGDTFDADEADEFGADLHRR